MIFISFTKLPDVDIRPIVQGSRVHIGFKNILNFDINMYTSTCYPMQVYPAQFAILLNRVQLAIHKLNIAYFLVVVPGQTTELIKPSKTSLVSGLPKMYLKTVSWVRITVSSIVDSLGRCFTPVSIFEAWRYALASFLGMGGVRSPKKKPTFPKSTIKSYKNWKKWNLATISPLFSRGSCYVALQTSKGL